MKNLKKLFIMTLCFMLVFTTVTTPNPPHDLKPHDHYQNEGSKE